MAKLEKDWLGAFIASEISGAVEWANTPKRTLDELYEDDGSNLRKRVVLGPAKAVQLRQVFSADEEAEVLVSDGFTQLRAVLSTSALKVLEEELEANVDESAKGDVFILRDFTVVCTTYGNDDRWVTLDVSEIEYRYHLRKAQGQPVPIQQRPDIALSLEKIKQWRTSLVPMELEAVQEDSPVTPPSQPKLRSPEAPRSQLSARSQISARSPQSQAGPHRRRGSTMRMTPSKRRRVDPSPAEQSQNTLPFATQIPQPRPTHPTLSEDGLEISTGINLSEPIAAPGRDVTSTAAARAIIPGLSSLLSKGHGTLQSAKANQTPPRGGNRNNWTRSTLFDGTEMMHSQRAHDADEDAPVDASSSSSSPRPVEPVQEAEAVVDSMDKASAAPVDERERLRSTSPPRFLPHKRRYIPPDQQALLEKPSSWYPPRAGQRFHAPNLPIDLYNQFAKDPARKALEPVAAQLADDELSESSSSIPMSESSESSEGEEIPWSSSPPQSPKLPPDSSLEAPKVHSLPAKPPPRVVEPPPSSGITIQGTPSASQELLPGPASGNTPIQDSPSSRNPGHTSREIPSASAASQNGSTTPKGPRGGRGVSQTWRNLGSEEPKDDRVSAINTSRSPYFPPHPRESRGRFHGPAPSSPVPYRSQTGRSQSSAGVHSAIGRRPSIDETYNDGQSRHRECHSGSQQSSSGRRNETKKSHNGRPQSSSYKTTGQRSSSQRHSRDDQQVHSQPPSQRSDPPSSQRASANSTPSSRNKPERPRPADSNASHQIATDNSPAALGPTDSSLPGTVIPGTQYSSHAQPSSPRGTDPSERHRNFRSKYLWESIRQAWCDVEVQSLARIGRDEALARYKEEHPNDDMTQEEFHAYVQKALDTQPNSSRDQRNGNGHSQPESTADAQPSAPRQTTERISTPAEEFPSISISPMETPFDIDRNRDPMSTAMHTRSSSGILDKASMPPPASTRRMQRKRQADETEAEALEAGTPEPVETYSGLLRVVQRKRAPELRPVKQDSYAEFAKKYNQLKKWKQVFPKDKGMGNAVDRRKPAGEGINALEWKL